MLNFNISEKRLGLGSPTHFVHDFSIKMFLMLYSINWPNFIVKTKTSRQKPKYLENKKSL